MSNLKIPPNNYYELKHEGVQKRFEGELTFVNTFSIEGLPVAIYKSKKPNKEKGHKKYMGLFLKGDTMYVVGYTPQKLAKYKYRSVIQCLECDKVIESVGRHDYVTCGCPNNAMIDGGDSYIRFGAKDMSKIISFRINVFNGEMVL